MSAWSNINSAIYNQLLTVFSAAVAFDTPKFSSDWSSFVNLFAVAHPSLPGVQVINFAWCNRRSVVERAGRDEEEAPTWVERDHLFEVLIFLGFHDDASWKSESIVQEQIENTLAAFRYLEHLGQGTGEDYVNEPAQLESCGLVTLGEVLVHKAVVTIKVTERKTT